MKAFMVGMLELFPDGKPVDKALLRRGLAGPVLNLQGFGAVPDGETDIAPAFERALAAMAGEAILLLPPGKYFLQKPVILRRNDLHISLHGAVIDATGLDGTSFDGIHHVSPVTPAFLVAGSNVNFSGGHLTTTTPARAAMTGGIVLSGAKRCSIGGMQFTGGFYASIWPGGGSEDIHIESCWVEGGSQNIVLGFISRVWPQVTRITLRDVTSIKSDYHGVLAHGYVQDLQISGGFYRANRRHGIALFTCAEDVTITGVHCTDNGFKGLDFKHLPEWTGGNGKGAGFVGRLTIQGCHMHGNGHAGCNVSISSSDDYPDVDISHFLIEGNQAHDNGDHGFYLILREGIVANNIARRNGNRGFNFLSCRDVVISGNLAIDNCRVRMDSTEGFGFHLETNGKNPPPNRRLTITGNIARRSDAACNQVEGFALGAARIEDSTFVGNVASGHPKNIVLAGNLRGIVHAANVGT